MAYESKFPPGLVPYCKAWLESGIREEVEKLHRPGGKFHEKDDAQAFVHYLIRLGQAFLDQKLGKLSEIKRVRDSANPALALDCLGFCLGLTPETGAIHFPMLLEKFPDSFGLSEPRIQEIKD